MMSNAINATGTIMQKMPPASEQIDIGRKKVADSTDIGQTNQNKNTVQPEEFLNKIKSLTENGTYSVRFETDDSTHQLVVKVVDVTTDEVIRQVPPEELLGLRQALTEYEGNFVNTKS